MKNRKYTVIALVVLMMAVMLTMVGCGCSRSEEPTVPPTQEPTVAPTVAPTEAPTEPAPTEPEWVAGKAKANYVEAVYATLNAGDEVEVTGEFAHYYVIKGAPYDLLVDKNHVRLDSEEAFKTYTAYSYFNRPVYDSVYMRTAPVDRLTTNTKLTVLEAKGDWVFVEWNGGKGYMKAADISKYWIDTSGGSSSGGSSTKPADGTDVDVNSLAAMNVQGGIIKLGEYYGPKKAEKPAKGVVIADKIEAYLTVFGFGEELKVIAGDDKTCTIYLAPDLTVTVPRELVRLEGDPADTTFTGYSVSGAVVFKEYQSRTEVKKLGFNGEVQVLYKLPALTYEGEEIYAVVVDGETMYMKLSTVSETKHKVTGGGGGGSSSSSSSSEEVWTPPML